MSTRTTHKLIQLLSDLKLHSGDITFCYTVGHLCDIVISVSTPNYEYEIVVDDNDNHITVNIK